MQNSVKTVLFFRIFGNLNFKLSQFSTREDIKKLAAQTQFLL